jgi:hypothetical protein
MENLKITLQKNDNYIDHDYLRKNKTISDFIYSLINIHNDKTPFDYFDSLWRNDDGTFGATIFIEPVGNVSFKAGSIESFFTKINHLFNAQPKYMDYSLAGHKIYCYAKRIRKGMGIDLRYVNMEELWEIDIYKEEKEEELPKIVFDEIKKGKDLFDYIKQKNRLDIVILESICFRNDGIEDLMIGEIIYADEYMPDFFKIVIDFAKYEVHNQTILKKSDSSERYKEMFPKSRIIEYFISYKEDMFDRDDFQILKQEDILFIKQEAKEYYESGFDGDYLEYKEYKNQR